MPSEVSQNELRTWVEEARDGSLDAFYQLYSHYSKPIFNFIWRLIGSADEAEDLTQDTFLKVHTELVRLRDPAQFRFWLYRIARNEVYQRLRQTQRRIEVSIDNDEIAYFDFLPDESHGLDPEKRILGKELQLMIQQALQTLRPKYRDVFVLAVFERMSYEDITKIVGRSLLSVKTDIYRARLAVKEYLTKYLERPR